MVNQEAVVDYRESDTESDYDSDRDLFKTSISNAIDSDDEFEKITSIPMQQLQKLHFREYSDDKTKKKKKGKGGGVKIEHEYDKMDPIDVPRIHLEANAQLEVLGKASQSVDCLLKIPCDTFAILDFDTVLFDEQRKVFGVVYDILGSVREPIYLVRFNSAAEAHEQVGKTIYYAPNNKGITKMIMLEELQAMRITDHVEMGEEECPDFSDDEKEKQYYREKQNLKRSRNQANQPRHLNQHGHYGQQQRQTPQRRWQNDWHRKEYCYSEQGYFYEEKKGL
ncbi:unnamed protein product, partial [Mesorhabditis belari]|uniref:H/ACA ribonucleoprotein complex subunit n=1 Tax=Mesorhabditis belari TaxID=2138241 RepID=A0AAF3J3E4_9BILA